MAKIRSPICSVLGHVDHGKSSILDKIRGTAIIEAEAGKITQAIGASIIPLETIKRICGDLLGAIKQGLTIPGLLFIDTPGHAAFASLRKRGGALADIAILVVDINEGFKPQTIESIEILKASKTPFIIAANKLDLLPGWRTITEGIVLQHVQQQTPLVITKFENQLYEIVGKLGELELQSERFDRVDDYTKQIAIVPVSAVTGEGIPELLMVLSGLAQKYLEGRLELHEKEPAKGTVLEVKEEKGLGTTLDVIIYDGTLHVNDTIVIGSVGKPIVTKVKALLEPDPHAEMRDKKSKFTSVKEVSASIGVKISAKDIESAVSGMPVLGATPETEDALVQQIDQEVHEVLINTDKAGVVIKADSLGSLEALLVLLKEKGIPVSKTGIGDVTKKDLVDAESHFEKDPLITAILGFNIKNDFEQTGNVKVLTNDVVYRLIEEFEQWREDEKKRLESKGLESVIRPYKIEVMKGYIFRQNNPAVFGVVVLGGILRPNTPIMNTEGKVIGTVKSLQAEQDSVDKAEKGKQVAVSLPNVTLGRQVNEGDTLYCGINDETFRKLKEYKQYLSEGEKEVLREIAVIMRRNNPVWGI